MPPFYDGPDRDMADPLMQSWVVLDAELGARLVEFHKNKGHVAAMPRWLEYTALRRQLHDLVMQTNDRDCFPRSPPRSCTAARPSRT